ncbi:MBL fold metallo-hydrolase [Rhodococcus sp. NPDC059968]|uniref:MBL fold metallo-hydrolase n=1 Tax=Rhodococcus sp. NPDC059968 TaxID=3347017 RepID=UPI0036702409
MTYHRTDTNRGRIVPLLDGIMELDPLSTFPGLSADDWNGHEQFLSRSGALSMPYGGFLVESSPGSNVLVDVGGGPMFDVPPDKGSLAMAGRLPEALFDLGVERTSIRAVLLTHLHVDHIGWLAPEGEPFFPNATIYCHQEDWSYFVDVVDSPDIRIPNLIAGCEDRFQLWSGSSMTIEDLVMRHTPGHTPGSSVVMVGAPDSAVLVGDLVHSPVEFLHRWNGLADVDSVMAAKTRTEFKNELLATRNMVWGPHFPSMAPGKLRDASPAGITIWDPCCTPESGSDH